MALPGKKDIKVTALDALEFEPLTSVPVTKGRGWRFALLLIVAGAGAGAWSVYGDRLGQLWAGIWSRGAPGVPLVKAPPGPVKVRPDSPGGLRVPDRDKLVYGRMQGSSSNGDAQQEAATQSRGPERLLPAPEQPLPKPGTEKKPVAEQNPALSPVPRTVEKLVAKSPPQTPKPQLKPVAKVPTVKDVKTAKRPPPPPPPPQAPSTKAAPKAVAAAKPAAPKPVAAPKPAAPKPAAAKPVAAAKPAAAKPVAAAKPAAPKPVAAKPAASKPVAAKPAASKPVAAKPVPPKQVALAAPKPAPIPRSRSFLVQLAAARSPQGARDEWTRLRTKNLDLLGNLGLTVTKADLGPARGIFYRLRAGPLNDESSARTLCKRLAERKIGCLIIKPGS